VNNDMDYIEGDYIAKTLTWLFRWYGTGTPVLFTTAFGCGFQHCYTLIVLLCLCLQVVVDGRTCFLSFC